MQVSKKPIRILIVDDHFIVCAGLKAGFSAEPDLAVIADEYGVRISPHDLSQQFCGACHRSWEQVCLMELRGVENVRFQPYRRFLA